MEPPTKRKYEANFKLKVTNIAKGLTDCIAARQFDVRWCENGERRMI